MVKKIHQSKEDFLELYGDMGHLDVAGVRKKFPERADTLPHERSKSSEVDGRDPKYSPQCGRLK